MSEVAIRRARPEDAAFLAWAVLASARSHCPRGFWDLFLPDRVEERDAEDERLAFARDLLLSREPSWWHWSRFWIAERERQPAATLSGFDPARVVAANLAVPEVAAARGIAGARLHEAFARCKPMFDCFHEPAPGAWVVESVATRPEARGAGLASALLAHVLAEGRAAGHRFAQLGLLIGNTAAQRVYERAGFAITAEKRSAALESAIGTPGLAQMTCPL
jgi:ribosomal protein S18 acetylase RimI-like enzyme